MKNFNKIMMVLMVAVLIGLMPACAKPDIDEQDDIVFVSLDITRTDYPGESIVTITPHVQAISTTMTTVSAVIYINGVKDDVGERVKQVMPGGWQDLYLTSGAYGFKSGTYEIRADCTLQSTGKTVTKTTTIVVP